MADGSDLMSTVLSTHSSSHAAALAHFSAIPWTAAYLQSPVYKPEPNPSRTLKPTGEDGFFAQIINTPTTIPHCVTLALRDPPALPTAASPFNRTTSTDPFASPVPAIPDVIWLLALAVPDLNGHPSTLHGGLAATILDEIMGCSILRYSEDHLGVRTSTYTARIEVQYRSPVPLPGDFLARAWLTMREGRKWWVRGQIVNHDGLVMTEAEGLWVEKRQGKI